MSPVSTTGLARVAVSLRPEDLIAAWRPDAGCLVLTLGEPLRLQQRVVARVTVVGLGVAATVTGRVVSSSRHGDLYRLEIAPDEMRHLALQKLVAIAKGEPVDYQNRSPRFLAALPAVVQGAQGTHYRTTFSVSVQGCGLAWSGPVPKVGDPLEVRVGAGSRAASFRSVVCWTSETGRSPSVGVRFLAGPQRVWASVIAEVEGSGAPIA